MKKSTTFILILLGSFLFGYTALRAGLLAITWDEAYSYMEYVRKGIFYPEKFENMSANNHLLNTWLSSFFVKIFGVSEFILRIPALVAHLLFLIYSAKLVAHFQSKVLIISSFLIINLNPYLLDFFSLSRGYGLSIGLMMASIYYLYAFQITSKNKLAVYAMLYGAFGVLANYVLLNYFLALFASVFALYILQVIYPGASKFEKEPIWKNMLLPGLIFIVLLLFVLPVAFKLRSAGALYFGGEKSFWRDTFYTIVDRWFYELGYNYWFQHFVKMFIILTFVLAILMVLIRIRKKELTRHNSFLAIILTICLFCVSSTIVQHYLFGTLYLVDRTALFFTVLFPIVLVFLIQEQAKKKNKVTLVAAICATAVAVHTALSLNLTYVLEWKPDANTKEMLSDLEKLKQVPAEKGSVSLNIPLLFEAGINFYRGIHHLNWLNAAERSKKRSPSDDYYYLSPKELAMLHPDSIEILKTYPVTNNVLVKPKYKWSNPRTCLEQEMTFKKEPGESYLLNPETEYSPNITYMIPDSIAACKPAILVLETMVMATAEGKNDVRMVISLENEKGCYHYRGVSLLDFIRNKDEWTEASLTCVIPEEMKAGDKLLIYLWNPDQDEMYIKRMGFRWLRYDP